MTLSTTDTQCLTVFPNELKEKKKPYVLNQLWSLEMTGLGRHLLDESSPLAAQHECPGTQQSACSAPA